MKLHLALLAALAFAASAFGQSASYYLPPGVTNIRAIVTGGVPNPSNPSADWQNFCATNRVGLAQLSSDLPAIATATSHPEIAHAPLVLTGNSAASEGAVATAIASPANVVAIIGTHGAMLAIGNDGFNVNRGGDTPGDIFTINAAAVAGIPQVHTFDNGDGFVSPVTLQGWVQYGRSLGAPWYFLIHNDGNHTDSATALSTSILPWLAAILELRLPANAGTGDGTVTLNAIVEANGWLGDIKTKTIASFASYPGVKAQANWFPNQNVATAWAGYHLAPTYTIPAQPVIAPSGIIANLTVLDPANNDTTSGVGWRINANFKEADQLYNNIKWFVIGTPPASIAGLDWIRPIIAGKKYGDYTVDPIATFKVTADADVFLAHSDAIAVKPAWMQGFTDTGDNLQVSSGSMTVTTTMSVFKKTFTANSTVTLGANGATGGAMYLTFVKPLSTVTVPSVSVSATAPNATEGGASGQFTVTRTGATTSALTVNFSVSGTASSARYVALGTSVVIPAGQSSATVTVTTINDSIQQPTQTVVLTFAAAAAYNLGTPASATVNLLDDDTPALPVVSVLASNPNASEPNIAGAFQFTRTGDTTSALTVNFTLSGTATVGVDYTNPGASVVIAAGQTTATLAITPLDDLLVEGTETVTLSLATSANYTLGTTTIDTVNLADNDTSSLPIVTVVATQPNAAEPSTSGQWTLTRTGSTASALVVAFTTTGTAARAADYTLSGPSGTNMTIPAGQSSAVIALNVINDTLVEGTETAIFNIAASASYSIGSPGSATININDDDGGGGGGTLPVITLSSSDNVAAETSSGNANTGSVTITRTGSTTNALTVQLAYSGTAVNGADYATMPASVTIAAGQATGTLTLTPLDNSLVDGTRTAVISAVANAAYTLGSPAFTSILIADNDNAAPITTTGIIFATHGSGTNTQSVKLNVYLPATGSGPWPTVIYFPGGGWSVQAESSVTQLMLNLTASGYAVVSANYITSSFARWPAQIQDTKAAVRWVRANAATYGFDPTRIAVTGGSSGAHMAAYTAITGGLTTARVGGTVVDLVGNIGGNFNQSDVVQACAPFFPPTDILAMDHYATPGVADHDAANSPESGLIGFAIQTMPELAATVNPIIHVRAGLTPFWITNGTADTLVDFNQSELLNAALVKAGEPVTFWPVQGGGHGPGVSDSPEVAGLMKTFLDRTFLGATANALPVPTFTASTLTGAAPLTVTFDGSASTAPAGVITKYSWSNGDDAGASGATMTYTFLHAGIFPVTLCVRDDKGGTASVMQNVVVVPAGSASATPPAISITSPADGAWYARTGDLTIQASAAANGTATVASVEFFLNGQSFAWDSKPPYLATFGQLAPGAYTVTARVSDSTGAATVSSPVSFHVFGEADVFPRPSLSTGQFGASYYRFTDGTLAYTFERSGDLATWTPFTPTQTILTNGAQIQLMQATDPLSAVGIPKRFLRIKIAPAP